MSHHKDWHYDRQAHQQSRSEPAQQDPPRPFVPVDELALRFTYHPPVRDQAERYTRIRSKAREFAELIATLCPSSREAALAITAVEQAMMFANAAIARREPREQQ